MNFILFVLSKIRIKLLAANYLIIRDRNKLNSEQKSSIFLLYIMTLVSSANNIGSNTAIILGARSYIYIYIMNNGGPRIDPWGNPTFQCTPVREKFSLL
jgi:hypothetical protein